ncbi:MAG: SpoIIE family protein phosphatase [Acidimicrobiia bacterium]
MSGEGFDDDTTVLARAVIDALSSAVIVTKVDRTILMWNKEAERLFGWSEREVLGRDISDVLVGPEEQAAADAVMTEVRSGGPWSGDFSVLHKDGTTLRLAVSDNPVLGPDGEIVAIVGISTDVTHQRRLERDASALAERLALALDAGGLGTWRWEIDSGVVHWDTRLEGLFGLEPGEFDGTFEAYTARLHPDDAPAVMAAVREAVAEKQAYVVDHRTVWPDETVRWLQGKGMVTTDAAGRVTGTIGCVADVTDQVLVVKERERAVTAALEAADLERLSAERLAFLGQVNDALAGAETRIDVMRGVTRVAVPTLGEWCSIFVLPEDGSPIPDVEIAHADPEMVQYARELQMRFPYEPEAASGIPHVIRTGESEFYPEIDDALIDEADTTEEARDIVRSLRLRSAIAVPLVKRGRVIGALQFVNTESSRVYTEQDLALANAVANRVASTLENRRLAEHQRLIATTLQASLLPSSLPLISGVDLAVRYWAAGEGTEVGGDFYDVFEVGEGHWAVVIGDVCGTGPRAATLTGLARHTIRAAAWSGASGEAVLRQLNQAIWRSDRSTFCTAAYCELRHLADGVVLDVTAGGHPLPILRRADGSNELLGTPGTLLGAFSESEATTCTTKLSRGDSVVLYTDGVTDLAPPHDLSPEGMREMAVAAAASGTSADAIAEALGDAIEAKLPLAERDDDIALLVLRIDSDG